MDTVTISLERYKELEALEQSVELTNSIKELRDEKAELENAMKNDLIKVVTEFSPPYPFVISYRTENKLINDMVEAKYKGYIAMREGKLYSVLSRIKVSKFRAWKKAVNGLFSYAQLKDLIGEGII